MASGFLFRPDRVRAVFKDCELGITGGMPVFRILPEAFTLRDGVCGIGSAKRLTVTIGLDLLDRGFAALLDRAGRFAGVAPEIFRRPGCLRFLPADDAVEFPVCGFPCARLTGEPGYGAMPGAGHRLILEFEVVPPEPGAPYMVVF